MGGSGKSSKHGIKKRERPAAGSAGGDVGEQSAGDALALATRALARGNAQKAVALCREAHAAHGSNAKLLALLGRSLVALGRHEEAAPVLAQSISLDREDEQAHQDLGEALLQCGRAEVALVMLERAARLAQTPNAALKTLLMRAQDDLQAAGLGFVEDDETERTVILRLTDPSLAALATHTEGHNHLQEETLVSDALKPEFIVDETLHQPVADRDSTIKPGELGLALDQVLARDRAPDDDGPTVINAESGHTASRVEVSPPQSALRAIAPGEEQDDAGRLLSKLAIDLPSSVHPAEGRVSLGVEDVLDSVLGGRLLAGSSNASQVTTASPHFRLWRTLVMGAALGALFSAGVRLKRCSNQNPGTPLRTLLASDTANARAELIARLSASKDESEQGAVAFAMASGLAYGSRPPGQVSSLLKRLQRSSSKHEGRLLAEGAVVLLRSIPQRGVGALPAPSIDDLATLRPLPAESAATFEALLETNKEETADQRLFVHQLLARQAAGRGDLEAVAAHLQAGFKLDPHDPSLRHLQARLAGEAGNVLGATHALSTLLEGHPSDPEALADLALLESARSSHDGTPTGTVKAPLTPRQAALTAAIAGAGPGFSTERANLVLAFIALTQGRGQTQLEAIIDAKRVPSLVEQAQLILALSAGERPHFNPSAGLWELALGSAVPAPGRAIPLHLSVESGEETQPTPALFQRLRAQAALRGLARGAPSPSLEKTLAAWKTPEAALARANLALREQRPLAPSDVALDLTTLPGGRHGAAALAFTQLRALADARAGRPKATAALLAPLETEGALGSPGRTLLIRARLERGEGEAALRSVRIARQLDVKNIQLARLEVVALHESGLAEEARTAMSALQSDSPLSADSKHGVPGMKGQASQTRGAAETESPLIESVLLLYRATSLPNPEPSEALALLKRALSLNRKLADAFYFRGRLLIETQEKTGAKRGATRGAKRALRRYLKLAPAGTYLEDTQRLLNEHS